MRTVLMNLHNYLYAEAVERSLREDGDFRILNVADPNEVVRQCELTSPEVVLMEVTGHSPWEYSERMKIREFLNLRHLKSKVVLMVDENTDDQIAEQVKEGKVEGRIDGFIFNSVSTAYLSAYLQTV